MVGGFERVCAFRWNRGLGEKTPVVCRTRLTGLPVHYSHGSCDAIATSTGLTFNRKETRSIYENWSKGRARPCSLSVQSAARFVITRRNIP